MEVRCPHCHKMRLWGSFTPGSAIQDIQCLRCRKHYNFGVPNITKSQTKTHVGPIQLRGRHVTVCKE